VGIGDARGARLGADAGSRDAAAVRRADRAFAIATLASLAIVVLGPLQRRIELIGEDDLSGIWAGPRAIATGHDPYDPETWRPLSVALGTQLFDTPVYIYPPWVAVPLLPLGFLPLPVVSILWLVASLAAALLALRYALRLLLPARTGDHAVAPVALLLSWVGILTLVLGQWGYLLVAALFTAVLAVRSGHAMLAGLAALAFLANFLSASSVMRSCPKTSYARSGANRASRLRIWSRPPR